MSDAAHSYHTLKGDAGPFLLKERKSKFYGFAFSVSSREIAESRMSELWQRYKDASHVCYAYRIGHKKPVIRTNDDGEPTNSAGPPILGQIQAFDLFDVAVAVVRYYGGVNLGVGGLIHAYREAARGCLEQATVIPYIPMSHLELRFDYGMLDQTLRTIEKYRLKVVERDMTLNCRIVLEFPQAEEARIHSIFESLPAVELVFLNGGA